MRRRHARRTLSAVPAHLFTALPLICRELCVSYCTGHDRAPQEEDNEQPPKMDCKFHKLRLTTPSVPRKGCPRTLDTITQQRFQTKAGWYREHALRRSGTAKVDSRAWVLQIRAIFQPTKCDLLYDSSCCILVQSVGRYAGWIQCLPWSASRRPGEAGSSLDRLCGIGRDFYLSGVARS